MAIRKRLVNTLLFVLISIFTILLGLIVENRQLFQDLKKQTQKRSIPSTMLKLGETGKITRLFTVKGRIGVEVEGIDRDLTPETMPSSQIIASVIQNTELPVISIVVRSEDLYHPDSGIIAHPYKRGMKWERPAYLSYYENGELILASGVGLRVHGGKSRGMAKQSFRVYFRNFYGNPISDPGILFAGRRKSLKTFVIHNDIRTKSFYGVKQERHFTNPLAYDIARQIGCLTPKTKPVQFYLNGEYQGPYVLTEYIDEDFLKAYFGDSEYILVRTKGRRLKIGSRDIYESFLSWPMTASFPLNMEEVAEKVNLENLMSWILSILYCGTTDPFQGALVFPFNNDNAKWFWVNWDMDHSFVDLYNKVENPWEIDLFDMLLHNGVQRGRLRSVIFERLCKESPEFIEYFKQFFTDTLNYRITSQFLESRVNYYDELSKEYGIENRGFIDNLRKYIKNRHAVLRKQFQNYFDNESMMRLRITSNKMIMFEVNEHPVQAGFDGWYFRDTVIKIKIPKNHRSAFKYWRVNGHIQKTGYDLLQVKLTSNTAIEAVFL